MNSTRRAARVASEIELQPLRAKEPRTKALSSLAGASGGEPPRRPTGAGKTDTGHYAPDISPTFKPLPIRLSPPPLTSQASIPPRTPGPIVILGGEAFDARAKSPPPIPNGPILMLGGDALEAPSPRAAHFAPLPAPPQRPILMLGGDALDAPPTLRRAHTV